MIVGKSNDQEGKVGSLPDFETNEYVLVEVAILNLLINIKCNNNQCINIKDLIDKLRTNSEKYIYRVVNKLESKGYVENLTPQKREKLITITDEGEAALTTIIKFLYPGLKQQGIALKMFFDSHYIPE